MQDQKTGYLSPIRSQVFDELASSMPSTAPVITVGDIFKVRGCHFQITTIVEDYILAVGISRQEFYKIRRQTRLKK
jgi:hypothetical protein